MMTECSDWCAENVALAAESSAIPGPFQPWPFQQTLLDLPFQPDGPRVILIQKSVQIGPTKAFLGVIGFGISEGGNIGAWQPAEEDSRAFSRDSLRPLIEATPALAELADSVSKSHRKSLAHVMFDNGASLRSLYAVPRHFRRIALHVALLDEIDEMPISVGDQGAPLDLAEKRVSAARGVVIAGSTPTNEGANLATEMRKADLVFDWAHRCDHCAERFAPRWDAVVYPDDAPELAAFHCPKCGAATALGFDGARWQTEDGDGLPDKWPHRVGFRINALSNPLLALGDLARQHRDSRGDPEAEKTFANLVLGLPYRFGLEGVTADGLADRRATVERPPGAMATMGVDVQADRLEAGIWVWPDGEPHAYRHFVIYGETAHAGSGAWLDLAALIGEYKPDYCLVDCGHHGGAVRAFCRAFGGNVQPCRGYGRPPRDGVTVKMHDNRRDGRTAYIDTAQVKDRLFAWTKAGKVRFDASLEDDWFPGFLSESRKRKRGNDGRWRDSYHQTEAFNEPLDTAVYATAGMLILRRAGRSWNAPLVRRRYRDAREAA